MLVAVEDYVCWFDQTRVGNKLECADKEVKNPKEADLLRYEAELDDNDAWESNLMKATTGGLSSRSAAGCSDFLKQRRQANKEEGGSDADRSRSRSLPAPSERPPGGRRASSAAGSESGRKRENEDESRSAAKRMKHDDDDLRSRAGAKRGKQKDDSDDDGLQGLDSDSDGAAKVPEGRSKATKNFADDATKLVAKFQKKLMNLTAAWESQSAAAGKVLEDAEPDLSVSSISMLVTNVVSKGSVNQAIFRGEGGKELWPGLAEVMNSDGEKAVVAIAIKRVGKGELFKDGMVCLIRVSAPREEGSGGKEEEEGEEGGGGGGRGRVRREEEEEEEEEEGGGG